jgi:segregation and condensation protein A
MSRPIVDVQHAQYQQHLCGRCLPCVKACYNDAVEPYQIKTTVYEGPLDLLLALIEKRKLLINDIALAEVSDDYLKYLEQHPEFPVAETAQFVLIGSALLLIKSKSLLPVLSLTNEEQESIDDLQDRLTLLGRYTSLSPMLLARYGVTRLHGTRHRSKREPVFSPDPSLSVATLHGAMQSVLAQLPEERPKLAEAIVKKVVSLEDMMERLTQRINASLQVSFREFAGGGTEGKIHLIVSFLAMLELVRQGMVRVEQGGMFADITITADTVSLPHYG